MVQFGDDDLVASALRFGNRLAHEPHERSTVQSEYDFVRVRSIDEIRYSRAPPLDHIIDFARKHVRAPALDHPVNQVIPYRIDGARGQLSPSGVVEEDRAA